MTGGRILAGLMGRFGAGNHCGDRFVIENPPRGLLREGGPGAFRCEKRFDLTREIDSLGERNAGERFAHVEELAVGIVVTMVISMT